MRLVNLTLPKIQIYNTITAIQNDIKAANSLIFHMERMAKDIAEHDALDSKELIAQIKEKHSEVLALFLRWSSY